MNSFLSLNYETAFESLGNDYYDEVQSAEFPLHILRFRNDQILPIIGLDHTTVSDRDWIDAFGKFHCVRPFLAMRYHGYQFGEYNPHLGDGRGFLYGQVRGIDGELYDFGTKGSGRTPYSRNADGRLTLKGGVREVLAGEMLHKLGVKTSRCLSLIETGEGLWRGDEPSPTRSSVMIRFSRSHIRFGTLERLHYFKRPDLIAKLLDHVITYYYPEITNNGQFIPDQMTNYYPLFYANLVKRIAQLAAQWMVAGFCHGVLNTDNMSITGESFDYGPYAFIPYYDINFIAAYFDYSGLYRYGNQPLICRWNLEKLQAPLSLVMATSDLDLGLKEFDRYYWTTYQKLLLQRLGLVDLPEAEGQELVKLTLQLLQTSQVSYQGFFAQLRTEFNPNWRDQSDQIFANWENTNMIDPWRQFYYHLLQTVSSDELTEIQNRLIKYNPLQDLTRPVIESIWEPITTADDWEPFNDLLKKIWAS